ncbi:MAG: hypothetical protein JNK87_10190 [Bryobacterales bacterium]|nr:hypothetical protein [Bryobacterales bacterium]
MALGNKSISNWRDRILSASETRYINGVLRPALQDIQTARMQAQTEMRNAKIDKQALLRADLQEMEQMETKIKSHMQKTLGRASKL